VGISLGGFMVYRKYHWEQSEQCDGVECTALTAYVRIEGKWTRIGYYGSECKQFNELDLKQEEEDKKIKQRVRELTKLVRNSKRMSLDDIENWKKCFRSSIE